MDQALLIRGIKSHVFYSVGMDGRSARRVDYEV